jgi:pimeloyl-ACP methyl ester carboxylesterase
MPYATNPNDGVRIYYEVEGTGPPLILHVGFMGRLQDWRRVGMVDVLRDDFQLILIDPRGQGQSGKPHDVESYGIQRFVDDVVAVLEGLEVDRAHFLGYSMGAQIGFAAGVFAPDRFLSFILGGSHPYFDLPQTLFMPTIQEEAELLARGMIAVADHYEVQFGPLPSGVRDQWLENDGEALAANTLAVETYPDISEQLPQVSLPTLIYCGTEDEPFALAQKASKTMPNARFVALEGLNHPQVFRQTEHILPRVKAFLSQVATTA